MATQRTIRELKDLRMESVLHNTFEPDNCNCVYCKVLAELESPRRVVLTDDVTAQQKSDDEKYAGLQELSNFIIKRVRGEIGDILLTDECRVPGLILDWVKKVEKRIAAASYKDRIPRCPKCGSYKLGSCENGHTWEIPTPIRQPNFLQRGDWQ